MQQKSSFFVRSDISCFFFDIDKLRTQKKRRRKKKAEIQLNASIFFQSSSNANKQNERKKKDQEDLYTCTIPTCEENFYIQIQQDRQILIHTDNIKDIIVTHISHQIEISDPRQRRERGDKLTV